MLPKAQRGVFPRTPKDFSILIENAKGKWFDAGTKIGAALDQIISAEREIREWISLHSGDRNFGEIADDLEEQLCWLMRDNFTWNAGFETFLNIPRRFRAIRSRLGRIASLPLVKDLEKMDTIRPLWSVWFERWRNKPDQASLWEIGWLLEEWRIQTFAPDVELKAKTSEKIISARLGV